MRSKKLIALALSTQTEILSAAHARAQKGMSGAQFSAQFQEFCRYFIILFSTLWLRFKKFANKTENRLRFKEVSEKIKMKNLNFMQ